MLKVYYTKHLFKFKIEVFTMLLLSP